MTEHPFTRLTTAREGLASVQARRGQVEQRAGELRARISELEGEIAGLGGGARRKTPDAILSGETEPSEAELRKRVERTSMLRERITDLREQVSILDLEEINCARSAEGLTGEIASAEVDCLRALEAKYLEAYHGSMLNLIAQVLIPLRAIGSELDARGELADILPLFLGMRLPAVFSDVPPGHGHRVRLWVEGVYLMEANLPADLLPAAQEPSTSVVARLIEGLGQEAEESPHSNT